MFLTIIYLWFSKLGLEYWPLFQGRKADVVVVGGGVGIVIGGGSGVVDVEKASGIGDTGGTLVQLFGNIILHVVLRKNFYIIYSLSKFALFQISTFEIKQNPMNQFFNFRMEG